MQLRGWQTDADTLAALIRRAELEPTLLRRQIEEEITALVALSPERLTELEERFREQEKLGEDAALDIWLQEKDWNRDDLLLHLARPEALNLFAKQRFGPGLEDLFLQRKNDLDSVIYSLLRVRSAGLARELWISLSEGEISFPEAASRHSDGPEATTKGIIGPVRLGQIQPELAERLRSLQVGDVRAPEAMGEWHVLLRLEQLTPARLDDSMRQQLLNEQLDAWIIDRARRILNGEDPDPLHYDQPHESG